MQEEKNGFCDFQHFQIKSKFKWGSFSIFKLLHLELSSYQFVITYIIAWLVPTGYFSS